ncbi:hypothetical protein ACSQ6I_27950, partial [Anabaena sp. WFMT]|uniref:hypothetical protein n=1 Tax=Anabaena sp. WFMT TaxID=3449730 RepID=UPI003F250192
MELNSHNLKPTSSDVPQSPPRYWTNTRDEILSWLNENNSSLADLYKGAVYLTFGSLIPGKLRFISHAVREIRNRLPDSIPKISKTLVYQDEVGKIEAIWESNGFDLDEIPPEITINSHLFSEIQQLIKKHKAVRENNQERTFKFFELCISDNQLDRNILEPIVNHYWDITEWFMKKTHEPGKTHDKSKPKLAPDDQEIRYQFEQFESFLSTFSQKFYTTVDKLDEILTEDNPQQIEKVIGLLIHPQHFSYFFNRLQNPDWIEPLNNKGFFKNPPQIIEDTNQGTISFPLWPQSRYLARIAKDKPTEVLEIVRRIKSNNPRIYEDFVDAALQMPLQQAVQLVPKVKIWIESSYSSFLFPEKVADLIIHLAKGGQHEKALELARTLLVVMPDSSLNNSDNSVYIPSPKPRVRFDNWNYQEIIKKYIPELVKIVGEKALIMLIFLLNDAVKFSISNSEFQEKDNNSPILEDSSHYWRYAIEDHPRNHDPYDVTEILLQAVRDTAKQILEQDPTKISTIVQKLEQRRWRVFHRIALYLIREYKDVDPNLLIEKLVDSNRFTKTNPYEDNDYEYVQLLKENFDKLPLDKQEQILSWIDNPQIDWDWLEDQAKKAKWVRQWQQEKLTIIKDSLSIYWQERYQQLVNEFGNLELTNIFARGVSEARFLGVNSPITDSELESMSIEEIIIFLRTWEPKSTDIFEFEEPSRSGLASALARLAEKYPERYAQGADKFQCLYPTYISNFLRGLRQALNNQSKQQQEIKNFYWISVLSLCNWLAEKSTEFNQSLSIYDE